MSGLVVLLPLMLSAAVDGGAPPQPTSAAADGGAAPRPTRSLLARPPSPAPPGATSTAADRPYELRRAKDGSGDLVYESPGFTARIARDGDARFEDKRFAFLRSLSLLPFAPVTVPRGTPTIQSALSDLLNRRARGRRAGDDAPPEPQGEPVPVVPRMSPYRPDPAEACQYPRDCFFEASVVLIAPTWRFDLTDELMRLAGEDPYRVEKARFLAATRDLRNDLGERARTANARREAAALAARLEAIACDARRPVAERRAALEAMRREIDGDTPAAREAVATITRFLAARFDGADGGVRCP